MDNTRIKFSPSNIEQIEEETMARLINSTNPNKYEVPDAFKGNQNSVWNQLHAQFPAPPSVQYNFRVKLGRPRYDCFMPPSFSCACYKCLTHYSEYVSYCNGIMEASHVNESASGVKEPVVEGTTRPDLGIVYAIDTIAHVAHFYGNYVDVPGYSFVDETPSTPLFTKVHLKHQEEPSSDDRNATCKRIRRMRMTPTKLFF